MSTNTVWVTPLGVAIEAMSTFWKLFWETNSQRRMEKEIQLQCNLAHCPLGQEMSEVQLAEFLENSAAVRPFLHWNGLLTDCSSVPFMHMLEGQLMRAFVVNFHAAEGPLSWRLGVPWQDWTEPDTWREEFSRLLRNNSGLYRRVLCYDTASVEERNLLLKDIATLLRRAMRGVYKRRVKESSG